VGGTSNEAQLIGSGTHLRSRIISVVFLFAAGVQAQSVPPQTGTVKASAEVVLVPTLITDKSGNHISGLKAADFTLKQDGKPQPIAVFEEVKTDSTRERRSSGEKGTFSNIEPGRKGYHRLSIIVLDFVNTPRPDQAVARNELRKFLSQASQSGEPMCLLALTRGGLILIHDFTDDPQLLLAALQGADSNNAPLIHEPTTEAGQFPGSAGLAFLSRIVRANLEGEARMESLVGKQAILVTEQALRQIAKAFRGLPGRKSLIWASSGFPFSSAPGSECAPACPEHDSFDSLWRMMNDAQIAIYSVDLRPATAATTQSPGGVRPSDFGDSQYDTDTQAKQKMLDTSDTLRLFAEHTGGKAFLGGGNLLEAFRQATQDDSSYYMLGYYVNHNSKPGWHPIEVRSGRKGAQLRYRNGFLLARDVTVKTARDDVGLALSAPMDFPGLSVSVTWTSVEPGKSEGHSRVRFDLVMPPNFASVDDSDRNHMVVDIFAVARDSKGAVAAEISQRIDTFLKPDGLEQIQRNGMTYRNGLQLAPGEYRVRFVVRDALANRTGSVTAPVRVSP
jgi:VWFA-related protein